MKIGNFLQTIYIRKTFDIEFDFFAGFFKDFGGIGLIFKTKNPIYDHEYWLIEVRLPFFVFWATISLKPFKR